MIQQKTSKKTFICTNCHRNHVRWFGQCQYCKSWGKIEETVVAIKQKPIAKISEKRKAEIKSSEGTDSELDLFFETERKKALAGNPICEECGVSVKWDLESEETWINRRCLAHLIPKSKFPSISKKPENIMLLCWQHHTDYDHSWQSAREMNIWDRAVARVQGFYDEIKEGVGKLPFEFGIKPEK